MRPWKRGHLAQQLFGGNLPHLFRAMAGDPLIRDAGEQPQQGLFLPAAIDHEGTSSREPAARWRIDQARDFARNAVPHRTPSGIGDREGSEERLRIRVAWPLEDAEARASLCARAES